MADIDPAHVGRVQTFLMQKFMSYRKGEFEEFLVRFYNRGGYALLRPPMQTRWVDTETTPAEQQARQAFRRINRNAAEQRRYQEPWDGQQPPLLLPDGPQRALSRQQMRDVARRLTRQRIRYCKTIGWGGNGVVTLWKYQTNQAEKAVVIKSSIVVGANGLDATTLADEKTLLGVMTRAPHISQMLFLETLGTAGATAPRKALQNDPNLLLLEFAKLGSLDKWLRRAGSAGILRRREPFPRVIAWRFFDCLVKACIAMEYPPRFQPTPNAAALPLPMVPPADQPRWLPEVVPQPAGSGDRTRIVHMDLDPQNVLLPGLDEPTDGLAPDHSDISRLQISDFGLSDIHRQLHRVPTNNFEQREVHRARQTGKSEFWLPEQYTADWDVIPLNQDPYTNPQFGVIAGNYDSHSNVWHMGMIMRCVLLLDRPPKIPDAGRITEFENAALGAQVPLANQFWSCGADFQQDPGMLRQYGRRLCNLVARCLAYAPHNRPTLWDIQRQIARGLREDPNNVDARVTPAEAALFFDPPAPLPAVAGGRPIDTDIWAIPP